MNRSLDKLKDDEYQGVKELAGAAENILRETGPNQEKGTVAEYPNERTIRFYITEGLLPQSMEKRGAASLFGYQHLLALIVIKKLQADGLPISIIRQVISGKSEAELRDLIGESGRNIAEPEAFGTTKDIESVKGIAEEQVPRSLAAKTPEKNTAKEYLEGLLFSRPASAEPQILFSSMPVALQASSAPDFRQNTEQTSNAATWVREEIAPGLEVHIRDDYKPPGGYRETSRLLAKIKQILRR